MNRFATLCLISMFAASCSSEKFKAGDGDEDPAIDTIEEVEDTAEDTIEDPEDDTVADVPTDPAEEPECYEDADCDDGNRCTINECSESGFCRTTPFTELMIEVIESSDAPTVAPGTGQQLLQLRFSSLISIEIDEITWHIGGDCSGDGVIASDSSGLYSETGGHCEDAAFPLEGLYDDFENHGHVRNIEVQDLGTGATLQGPLAYPFFDLGITDDDGISIVFTNNFTLDAESVLDVVLIADLTTVSNMRANVNVDQIVFVSETELCIDVAATVLEGLTRTNEG